MWWMSFALDDNKTGYACIVEADTFIGAHRRTIELGINPGGELLGFPIPAGSEEESLPRDRLLTEDELRGAGAKRLYEVEGN